MVTAWKPLDETSALDSLIPQPDWESRHTAIFEASPRAVMAAARSVTLAELPGLFQQRQTSEVDNTVLEDLLDQGFSLCPDNVDGHDPAPLILVRVGRFWQTPSEGPTRFDEAGFSAFQRPGFARAALSLVATEVPQGVLVVADARLAVTDNHTRRELNRYWLVETWANVHNQRGLLRAIERRLIDSA